MTVPPGAGPEWGTPQAALSAFRRAMMSGDWPGALSLLSPRAREGLVGGAYAGAAWMDGHDEASRHSLGALMERHGLRDGGPRRTWTTDELAGMLADLDAWSREALPPDRRLDLAAGPAETTWSEFRVSGDRAYAIATCRGRRSETRLRQQDGRWIILAGGE